MVSIRPLSQCWPQQDPRGSYPLRLHLCTLQIQSGYLWKGILKAEMQWLIGTGRRLCLSPLSGVHVQFWQHSPGCLQITPLPWPRWLSHPQEPGIDPSSAWTKDDTHCMSFHQRIWRWLQSGLLRRVIAPWVHLNAGKSGFIMGNNLAHPQNDQEIAVVFKFNLELFSLRGSLNGTETNVLQLHQGKTLPILLWTEGSKSPPNLQVRCCNHVFHKVEQ